MAPTIVRDGKLRLFFSSREETRIHVPISHPDGEAKFWLTPEVELAVNVGLSQTQVRQAQSVVGKHLKESRMPGISTSEAEVTNISKHCFWLLLGNEELAVPFLEFPWFRNATIEQITNVQWPSKDHLYWPMLDVDLSVESIRNPPSFPLISKTAA